MVAAATQNAAAVKNRWILVAMALAAAIAFTVSVQLGRWWTVDRFEIGPLGSRLCIEGQCRSSGLERIAGDVQWARFGFATWTAGMLATLGLVMMAAGLAAKRLPRLIARATVMAIGTALVVGIVFFVQGPELPGVGASAGVWLFGLAVALGGAAAVTVARGRA